MKIRALLTLVALAAFVGKAKLHVMIGHFDGR